MGFLSNLFGGGQADALRQQARMLELQTIRERTAMQLQNEALTAQRLDIFAKDKLAQQAQEAALAQLSTPGASILLGDAALPDASLSKHRRQGFYEQNTSAAVL